MHAAFVHTVLPTGAVIQQYNKAFKSGYNIICDYWRITTNGYKSISCLKKCLPCFPSTLFATAKECRNGVTSGETMESHQGTWLGLPKGFWNLTGSYVTKPFPGTQSYPEFSSLYFNIKRDCQHNNISINSMYRYSWSPSLHTVAGMEEHACISFFLYTWWQKGNVKICRVCLHKVSKGHIYLLAVLKVCFKHLVWEKAEQLCLVFIYAQECLPIVWYPTLCWDLSTYLLASSTSCFSF